ncbi:muts domain V-domain-containing protein [Pisolithus croceorrhizus]|nr:muts domain V-domain-containing protein [Pisolithus croceorrhizus]
MSRKSPTSPMGRMQSQPRISAYFSQTPSPAKKRQHDSGNSVIDLTLEGSEAADQQPIKKLKLKQDSRLMERWRFDPSQRSSTAGESASPVDEDRKRRHQEFKRVLLGENSLFARSKHVSEQATQSDVSGEEEDEGSESDRSDAAFKKLTDLFSHKPVKRKGKASASTVTRKRGAPEEEIGPSGLPYTPAELQSLKLINENPGVVLMIESGYKYYFYEESATIASRELGIVAYLRRNLMTAFIPVHRRDLHVKKLLSRGHKVGIVEQTETAALKKASDNRNTLFERKLTYLYTATTYVDEVGSTDDLDKYGAPLLACFLESPGRGDVPDDQVSIAMIAITPSTGDVIWDEFDGQLSYFPLACRFCLPEVDSIMRSELETRLVHTRPAELVLPEQGLSRLTEKVLKHFASSAASEHRIRIERYENPMEYTAAFDFVTQFYNDEAKQGVAKDSKMEGLLDIIANFPQRVVVALAHAIEYLSAFSIADAFLGAKFFSKFANRTHMLLNSNTLTNLEIYQNQTDYTTTGSLMWILDHTTTKFGARLLKNWVGRPLTDKKVLQQRIDAIEEIITNTSERLVALRQAMRKLPDLAKGLCRIQYGQCSPQELATLLPAFNKVANAFDGLVNEPGGGFTSKLLNEIALALPKLKAPMRDLLGAVSLKEAAQGNKMSLWKDDEKYPALVELHLMIQTVESELSEELKRIRKILRMPSLQWTATLGFEYLVEVKKADNREVPVSWELVSSTKYLRRYYTPEVKKLLQERARYQELLTAEANKAYKSFLTDIVQSYYPVLRDAVSKLAIADCLCSLAQVALQDGYVRPEFTDDDVLDIVDGRHPMVEALRPDPFVPNTLCLGGDSPRSAIITGPNMGGKSSAVRMVALIAIMAQIGSYVPAKTARIGMCDGIITRMGASDELARGRSTFMVEMAETSEILTMATPKSLVILDELGRGTSTADGMAIADAVLHHLIQDIKCKTLFITHYPLIAIDMERRFPKEVQNIHMSYTTETRVDGRRDVTFLYRLTRNFAKESFGVECARLAGIPEEVLTVATERSERCRVSVEAHNRLARLVVSENYAVRFR